MKASFLGSLATAVLVLSAPGGELPAIFDKPFLGCFVGFADSRDFEFAIGSDGSSELFFKKGRARLSTHGCSVKFYYVLEEKQKGKKRWTNRTMAEDGFETSDKETAKPELGKPISFTATFTGDTKVEISHTFTKKGVIITNKIVEKKTENDVRVGVKVVVGDLYRHFKEPMEERELKSKIKKSDLKVLGAKGKKDKFGLYEPEKLQEVFPDGARVVSLESDRIADHEVIFSTEEEALGTFEFRQTREMFHGFPMIWWPDPGKIDEKGARLVVEVK